MTVERNLEVRTGLAAGDLSSDQYKFVVVGAGGVAVNTVAGGRVAGVLVHPAGAAGRAVGYAVRGVAKVVANANLAVGDLVMSTNAGKAAVATGVNFVVGRVVEAAAANGLAGIELATPGAHNALA